MVVITLISFLISYYTCYLVLKTAGTDIDYTDTLQKHFGRIGWTVGMAIFILNLFVPIIIYFSLLS
jgi:amino acid permease